ncbi:Glutamine-dependent NAD(+) synthetase [Dyadobacter sp. CECT 9275]|uniref:Glutamine-dependent NAD(+) synthetase n=1 Tax=Dyadobacter helix TaxID=2822344 RepID=A0A916JEK5_9BACT|nr:NAD(+) synthase [Dyadobacter sp. CECT 9275]CAG5004821.1 Glutamine-dependent NAD(+) synthetase [Dyadobacter sp. CECT 9275]
MPLIKAAAGVVNQTPMAWETNTANIIHAIEEARKQEITLLCLPELCITGYGCEDYFFAPDLAAQALQCLSEIVHVTGGMVVSVGLPLRHNNRLYNAACLIVNRQIAGFYCKHNLANNGIHYEARWFHAWPAGAVESIEVNQISYPIGDIVFDLAGNSSDGVRLAFEICEDAWVANRPGRRHYERGVDIILNPSASHFAFHKFLTRERLVIDGSRSFACSYIYTNLLGNEAGRAIYDGDAMIASNGELLVTSSRFSYQDFLITAAVIDTDFTRLSQVQNRSQLSKDRSWLVKARFDFPDIDPVPQQIAALEAFEKGGALKEEEFARAVCLALFDYLRKSRSNGFTISLSGGADSCACTALCGLMIRLADESIGLEAMKKKLSYIKGIQLAQTEDEIARVLIQNIYQGTKNSSEDTLESARSLAESIGSTFYNISINGLVENYIGLIEEQIGRKLTWEQDDIALQNIQARVRAPGVWLLTNLYNHLLLATSNRSEVAVGYATMDGDTSGSISPLAGIDKHYLRQWLRWLEITGCEVKGKHIQIEGLKKVNSLQPTAELRPLERNQTDEADLMPYDFLNDLERAAIRDKKSPTDAYKSIQVQYKNRYSDNQILSWTERFFRLWSRNQWKRERYAPSFHVDDLNLDPRSWCRFPILSGGFEKELEELREYAGGKAAQGGRKRIGF